MPINIDKCIPYRNQEIRDAILSLVHSYNLLDNKLERHEQRERSLGEQVKKGLITLQKNQRIFDPLKGTITRLEERVSSIETALLSVSTRAMAGHSLVQGAHTHLRLEIYLLGRSANVNLLIYSKMKRTRCSR